MLLHAFPPETLTLEIPDRFRYSKTSTAYSFPSTENRKLGETGASVKKILYTHKPKPGHFGWSGGRKYSPKNLGKLLGRPPFHF